MSRFQLQAPKTKHEIFPETVEREGSQAMPPKETAVSFIFPARRALVIGKPRIAVLKFSTSLSHMLHRQLIGVLPNVVRGTKMHFLQC